MDLQTMTDILHELIAVETEESLIKSTYEKDSIIYVTTNDDSEFKVEITKIR